MAISHKACSRCSKPVSIQAVPPIEGTEGAYKVTLEGVSVMSCGENHKRFVYPDLAMRLMDYIANPEVSRLYAASKRGLFKKRAYCAKCSTELPIGTPDSKDYRISVPLPDIQPVTLTLSAPVIKCARCGTSQLPDTADLMKFVFKAMAHAFRSAGIHAE
jgi:DNA-directed RNA polymerase subunit RPC12/RpoP